MKKLIVASAVLCIGFVAVTWPHQVLAAEETASNEEGGEAEAAEAAEESADSGDEAPAENAGGTPSAEEADEGAEDDSASQAGAQGTEEAAEAEGSSDDSGTGSENPAEEEAPEAPAPETVAGETAGEEAETDPAEAETDPAMAHSALKVRVTAQERVRMERKPDYDFDGDMSGTMMIGNRARLGVGLTFGAVGAYVQVQDVRNWGSEYNPATLGEGTGKDWVADGLDVHQAYADLISPYGLSLRIGRQEISWHGQRLIGAVGWSHQGRSFDAVRIRYDGDKVGADMFYALLLDRPVSDADLSEAADDQHLIALRGGPRLGDPLTLDGLAIVRVDDAVEEVMATVGAHAKGKLGAFRYQVEGYGQLGSRGETSIGAFLIGARVGAVLVPSKELYIGGGIDIVSGDSDPTDMSTGAFNTLYATNHGFYGHMDRYVDLPLHTNNEGLIDGMFNFAVSPHETVSVKADVHVFAAASAADSERALHGLEIDVNAGWSPWKHFTLSGGMWTYVPGSWRGEDLEPEMALYMMTDVHFK